MLTRHTSRYCILDQRMLGLFMCPAHEQCSALGLSRYSPRLWNSLHNSIRSVNSFMTFRSKFKTHLLYTNGSLAYYFPDLTNFVLMAFPMNYEL